MNIVKGNIIDLAEQGQINYLIHGCNCFNTMGAGLAKEIKYRYPEAYFKDLLTKKGSLDKLGKYTFANVLCKRTNKAFTIINAYTQYNYGKSKNNEPLVSYDAIRSILLDIDYRFTGVIGLPFIGCGLAGGDWSIVSKIITESIIKNKFIIVSLK